ncbi:MAG: hypothetical protein ACK5JD_06345 [Mangrovibacterium sp.]
MSKNKTFQLRYQVEAEKLEKVILLAFEIQGETGMEPSSITLPNGLALSWNGYAAHQFAAEGRITEKEFIKMCEE